jgi:hypothetical protein
MKQIGMVTWNGETKDNRNDPLRLEISINFLSFGDGTGFTSMSAVPFPVKNSQASKRSFESKRNQKGNSHRLHGSNTD